VECCAHNAAPRTMAASSKSLLVRVPVRFVADIKARAMWAGKVARHNVGWKGAFGWRCIQKPPIPCLEASVAAIAVGQRGTNVCRGTG
jgi:hypothetical protein